MARNEKWYRSLSLKSKLFILLILLTLIPTIFIGFFSQHLIVRTSTKGTVSLSSQIMRYMANDINAYLLSIDESLDAFVIDSEFQKFIEVPKDDIRLQAFYAISFRSLLQLLVQSKKDILGILYLDQLGKVYFESDKVEVRNDYSFYNETIYREALEMTSVGLTKIHKQNYGLYNQRDVISFVKPVKNIRHQTQSSWIIVEIDAQWIREKLSKIKFGENGQVLLYNPSNAEVVLSGENPGILDSLKNELRHRVNEAENFIFDFGGKSYLVAYDTVPLGDWLIVGVTPLEEMARGVRQSLILMLVVAVTSIFLAFIAAFPFMTLILKPLLQLKRGMKMLGSGVPVRIEHFYQDEIGFLIQTYNKMLEDLKKMQEEVLDTKLREKEKELLQLQAQINPHFLFNTLETIDSYSSHNDGQAVSNMLQCVSRMLRYNVRKDRGWAPLRDEMNYIHDFLAIHYYRNVKHVQTIIQIDDDLLDTHVMKLSIQPFVENSVKYGWSPLLKLEDFQLLIAARRDGNHIEFTIKDNGPGINQEVLGILQSLLKGDGETDNPYFIRHTGILNVYRRYVLVYGSQFSMNIMSNEQGNQGTSIVIRIPAV